MPFVDTSSLTSGLASSKASVVADVQNYAAKTVPSIPTNAASAVSGAVSGAAGKLSSTAGSITSSIGGVTSGLTSAVGSINSKLTGVVGKLTSSVSGTLNKAFARITSKGGSTNTTGVSDPTASTIPTANPTTTGFTISTDAVTPKAAGTGSDSSWIGTLSTNMSSTALTTVVDRYKLPDFNKLGKTLTSSSGLSSAKGLLSSVKSITNTVTSPIKTIRSTISTAVGTVNQVKSGVSSVVSLAKNTTASISRDVALFKSATSSVQNVLGTNSLNGLFSGKTPTLTGSTATVDATMANSIRTLAKAAGCTIPNDEYTSSNVQSALFGSALSLAIAHGMTDMVASLLDCETASSDKTAVSTAFETAANTNISLAGDVLDKLDGSYDGLSADIDKQLVTNSSLKSSDATTASSILSRLGTTPLTTLSVAKIDTDSLPIIDLGTVCNCNPSFLDSLTGSSTLSKFSNASTMTMNSTGALAWA
jgi:hypothetical protein